MNPALKRKVPYCDCSRSGTGVELTIQNSIYPKISTFPLAANKTLLAKLTALQRRLRERSGLEVAR